MKWVLIWTAAAVLTACASRAVGSAEGLEPCPPDPTLFSYSDTARGVTLPVLLRSTMPRGGFSRITVQGIVGLAGRVERGSVRAFGGEPEGRIAAGDALFWSRFAPAMNQGCAVRFLYRITYMAGIPQRVPDDPSDSTAVAGGRRP